MAKAIRLFSERVLSEKCVPVELPTGLREQISMILEEFNFAIEIPGSSSDSWVLKVTDVLTEVTEGLEQLYGVQQLWTFDDNGDPVSVELEDFVKMTKPAQIFDVLELFYHCSEDSNKPDFQRTLNDALQEYKSDWRLKKGRFCGNTAQLRSKPVAALSDEVLEGESCLVAALDQFHEAQSDLERGDYQGAVDNTCNSLESVLKSFLGRDSTKPGSLVGPLDGYGASSSSAGSVGGTFGEQVLKSLSFLRDTLGEGAAGGEGINMPKVYAELAVHLSGSFILFATNLIINERSTPRASTREDFKRLRVISEAS